MRTVGLAWRRTSSRKSDFTALGNLIRSIKQPEAAAEKPAA
jgi:LysR family hydrogen peroxide-inducible transcriptional activator